MSHSIHVAVMTEEAMQALNVQSGGVYIDATLGGATHTEELLKRSAPKGQVISFDVDVSAIKRAKHELAKYGTRFVAVEENFRDMAQAVQSLGIKRVDGILIDLGFSSDELQDPEKGLSFQVDAPLDMRLGQKSNRDGLTAAEIVNTWNEGELVELIKEYGEERMARRIAKAIIQQRKRIRIGRTLELARIIAEAVPQSYERGRIHPATRTFQALRIAVNDEIGALKQALQAGQEMLAPGGRIAVISFHSLEDRVVKKFLKNNKELSTLFKKPLTPTQSELIKNPKSRSAKLRAAEKTDQNKNKICRTHSP